MSKKVILLNGAPNSGKDESAKILKKLFGFGSIHSFKDELYKETAEYYGLDLDKFKQMAKDSSWIHYSHSKQGVGLTTTCTHG